MYVLKCDCGLNVLYLVGMTDDLQKEKNIFRSRETCLFLFSSKKEGISFLIPYDNFIYKSKYEY